MIDNDKIRESVVKGLRNYLGIPVIRSNQEAEPPAYPYISFTVTILATANNGTWQVWDDGIERIPVTQKWSMTSLSDNDDESVEYAMRAREWLQHRGSVYLGDNHVIVQSVTGITNRDNVLTVGWEYRNGFDVTLWLYEEALNPNDDPYIGYIEKVQLNEAEYVKRNRDDLLATIEDLEELLNKANKTFKEIREAIELKGIDVPRTATPEDYAYYICQMVGVPDAELDENSTGAIQNRAVALALKNLVHEGLLNREVPDQHPIAAITELESELNERPDQALSNDDIKNLLGW